MSLLPHLADGSVELTAPVARYLPGFGDNGKDGVTVLQLLTMQGGFPQALIGPDSWGTSEGRRRQFAEWTLAWPSGTRTEYHPIAAHWVIAELIETLSGRPYAEVINERVPAAAGVPTCSGPSSCGPVITIRTAGSVPDHAHLLAEFGREDLVPDTTVSPELLLSLNDPRAQAAAIPGGGGIARAVDMATIYQSFLHNPDDAHPGDWLADARGTVPQREHHGQRRYAGQPHHCRRRLGCGRHERLPLAAPHSTRVRPRRCRRATVLGRCRQWSVVLVPPRHPATRSRSRLAPLPRVECLGHRLRPSVASPR